ncbi:putative NAD(+) diphosphatase [Candidatus Moduliflexus flocculans]|uniref:NAD-capped RNA hydrolase NudC n=1 Tax=Candidatus Moduliflexus flocculans TaxID=1499966 RepID=A0A081BPQ8_9BACT|nr:putative NAD(+) diphosphatase [Candidatus Moduliflexus flocculans]
MHFFSSVTPPDTITQSAYWCIFRRDAILVRQTDAAIELPMLVSPCEIGLTTIRTQYLGTLHDTPCYSAEILPDDTAPEGMTFNGLRELFYALPEDLYRLAGRAFLIMDWDRTHQYCGRCGHPTEQVATERAKRCPRCELTVYPRISPAMITAVIKDRQILLAHAHRMPTGMHSVLAGFVEAGETFEECVRREVMEEVGIEVTDIQYFGSQPWPFPNSLMVAFTAKYAGGEIRIDPAEILCADWYSAENLPTIPGPFSIARRLIDWFVAEQSKNNP